MSIATFFKISENKTSISTEILAGITTFAAMAYMIAVVPGMLHSGGGLPLVPTITAVLFTSVVASVVMGLYTNRPFVLGPGLGSVAIIAFTVVGQSGVSFPVAMGIVFIEGVIFMAISFLGVRDFITVIIPKSVKTAVAVGIGLFIALLGFRETGIVIAGPKNNLIFGNLGTTAALLSIGGFFLIVIFSAIRFRGGLIVTLIVITLLGIPLGVTKLPDHIVSAPSGLGSLFLHIDVLGALRVEYIPFLLALLIPDFFSSLGSALGVGGLMGALDKDGNLPEIEKVFYVDSTASTFGALFSVPVIVTYLESAAGVESGGRTGLTAVVSAICFAIMLFFVPLAVIVPQAATAPILMYIGISMMKGMRDVDYTRFAEYLPAFTCVVLTIFTFNVGNGVAAALIVRAIAQIVTGHAKDDHWSLYLIAIAMVGYFYLVAKGL